MKFFSLFVAGGFLLVLGASGCGAKKTFPQTLNATPGIQTNSHSAADGLFVDTSETRVLAIEPHIARSRFVKLNLGLLLDNTSQARRVKEVTINLFPDVVYIGLIEQLEQSGDVFTWSGVLQNVENSYFTMVYTSGAFMGHFGSPLGVYEVVFVENDLYRIIQIDQTKFPGGEG